MSLNNRPITRLSSFTFLGIIIDQKLTFREHVAYVCRKIAKTQGVMLRLNYLPSHILQILYYSLVYPYLNYCVEVWGPCCPSTLYPLVIRQKKIVRIINGSDPYEHTNPIFKKLKLLKFEYIVNVFILVYIYKVLHKIKAPYIFDFITNIQVHHRHNLRNENKYKLPKVYILRYKQSLIYQGLYLWNNLPNTLKISPNYNVFKRKILAYYHEF